MLRDILTALMACVVTFALCAIAYPAVVYGLGQTLFPAQAEGSLIERDGKVIGSSLIAQPFTSSRYFSPRPSAAGSPGYHAEAASGSNLGTQNPALRDRITLDLARRLAATHPADQPDLASFDAAQTALDAAKAAEPPDATALARLEVAVGAARAHLSDRVQAVRAGTDTTVPADLVTTSGSGLDPDISPEAAFFQASRVAAARGLPVEQIRQRIEARIDRTGALLGNPPRVNVLRLNLDLDDPTLKSTP